MVFECFEWNVNSQNFGFCIFVLLYNSICLYSLSDCWKSDAHERPLFPDILRSLEKIGSSGFPATDADSFRSMQESWKHEIELSFDELKEREKVRITSFILLLSSLLIKYKPPSK